MDNKDLHFQRLILEQKAQRAFQDTYAAITSGDVHKALFYLGILVTYIDLLGNDYREDSRYYILSNLILHKFDIQTDGHDRVKH